MKAAVEWAAVLLFARGAVYALSLGRHQTNPVWLGLRFLTRPLDVGARALAPPMVLDKHIPMLAFVILAWCWVLLVVVKSQALAG